MCRRAKAGGRGRGVDINMWGVGEATEGWRGVYSVAWKWQDRVAKMKIVKSEMVARAEAVAGGGGGGKRHVQDSIDPGALGCVGIMRMGGVVGRGVDVWTRHRAQRRT